ncbi:BatA domain-containing protein [Pontibacter locisalis]|uniref:BatA domain-containing protein n=1 Tax=Pontibacter locisalis TaxID=1719035 RepID=A0ABW5IMF4_9BACT
MIFLAPYWLFAASAILIPIAIHLWNKRQGKTVKVGSLRWLEPSSSRRWSSIRLTDAWLLALRCLILILLAAALAQPVLVQQPRKPEGKKVVYLGQELLYTSALKQIKPTVDSLLKQGYSLRTYTPDFRQIPQEEWQQISSRITDSTLHSSTNYWSLLPVLAEKHKQASDSVWLFTSDQQRFFAGSRPEVLPINIRWVPITTDAQTSWLQTAVKISQDSLLLIVGNSSRNGITYSRHYISAGAQSVRLPNNQTLQLQNLVDTLQAKIGSASNNVQVQTKPLQVSILADEAQQQEARFLKAAIQSISSYTSLPININADTTTADWFFWLRAEEVPEQVMQQVQQGSKLWVQQQRSPRTYQTNIAATGETGVKVRQISAVNSLNDKTTDLWIAANSQPVLSVQPIGAGKVYTFRSGFTSTWSELGRSAQLPELLLPLLLPAPEAILFDLRALDEQQLIPTERTSLVAKNTTNPHREPLLPWIILAAFVLFLIERVISNRRSKASV